MGSIARKEQSLQLKISDTQSSAQIHGRTRVELHTNTDFSHQLQADQTSIPLLPNFRAPCLPPDLARKAERHIHNLARLVRYKGRRRCGQIKSAPLRRSRTRHDQAPLEKSGRGAQSGGIRLARYTLRNRPPSFYQRKLVFFVRSQIHSYAYHLVSVRGHDQRVRSPIQGFSRCEGISFTPALNKDQHSRGSRPKNDNIISSPTAPRQSPRPPTLARGVTAVATCYASSAPP